MAQNEATFRPIAPRSLRMESLERRDLLSVTLVAGTETFKSFEFLAARALAVGGTWKVHQPEYAIPFKGSTTGFHGTASYTSRTDGTIAVDVLTAKGTYSTPRGGGGFSLTNGSITDGIEKTGRFTGQLAGDVRITGLVKTNTTLAGPMTGSFNGAKQSLNLWYKKGDVNLHVWGAIKPQSAVPFSVVVNNPVWTQTGLEVDVAVRGGVHKVASNKTYNTPVAFVKLYWATGSDYTQRISELKDKLPIYWNEAGGKYVVAGLPMPTSTATHLLLAPEYDGQVGTVLAMALPPKPGLSIDDVQVVEGNTGKTGLDFHVTLSAAMPFSVTVSYATILGTANTLDFIPGTGKLTFAPGETQKTTTIQVKGDTKIEGDETFSVQLKGPSWATLTDPLGVGTIVNDDPTPPALDAALQTWTAADVGPELASYFAADQRRKSSARGLATVRDAVLMESVL